ncbi:MAG TPA: tetratricopeptide repeat protein [Puia sp.]|nr:tetratricopeptide repeat protein [Puia sp.]
MNQLLPGRLSHVRLSLPGTFLPQLVIDIGRLSLLIFLLQFFLPGHLTGQKTFDFNANCRQAYQEIIRLKLGEGQMLLKAEKKAHPDNLVPVLLENYIDFFVLFFNEDPAEYQKRKQNLNKRLQLMDQGPPSSPFYLFSKSVIHFQWAAIKIKFDYNWDAGWEFRRSFLQVEDLHKRFPSFLPANMLGGAMQVAAGTIPDGFKWLGNLLGIHGSIREGMQKLETFLNESDNLSQLFHDEAIFYYLYLKFYIENKREEVVRFIRQHNLDTRNNHLFAYLAANISLNNQQSAYAQQVILEKNESNEYLYMPVWNLEMGYAKLNHLDPDANKYLEKFMAEFRGKFYVKEVLQKLSWYYFLQGDQAKAQDYRQMVLEMGSLGTEADKQAQKEAKSGKWPNKRLLSARLLNDGGYTKEAFDLLQGKSSADFTSDEEKLEFAYRLARIYDDLGRTDDALSAYLTTLKTGEHHKEYYAARAALQIGYIYEKRDEKQKAIAYFQKVISLKDHDYKNSLDQKAKAGIARCSND